ncbi:MAG: restriction endonuclease subunit S [Chloroflexota bacterium]
MSEWQETEIGQIPVDWNYTTFETVLAEPTRNGIYKPKEYHGRGTKVINMGELFNHERLGNIEMQRIELTEQELEKSAVLPGDLIFARRSLVAEGAGKCSLIIDHNEPMTFESSIIRARPDKCKASSEFLFYLFKSRIGRYLMGTILRQVAVSGITASDLVQLSIPIPPLDEQNRIAGTLSTLDIKIDLLRRQNNTLEQIAQTLFKRWFVEFEFPNEQGQPYKSSGGVMVASKLGEIPERWRVECLEECLSHLIDNRGKTPRFYEEGIPALSAKFVKGGRIINRDNFNYVKQELFETSEKLQAHDIIMTSEAPLGELYYITTNTTYYAAQRVFALRANPEICKPYFLYRWLSSKLGQHLLSIRGTGTTVIGIKQSELKQVEVLLPDIQTQRKFELLFENLLFKIGSNEEETQTLTRLRDTLLPKLMSGQIRVNA